jgi:hypothetical protein
MCKGCTTSFEMSIVIYYLEINAVVCYIIFFTGS